MNFSRTSLAVGAALALTSVASAMAADLPVYEAPAPYLPAEPYKPWQGLSVGLLGTYGFEGAESRIARTDMDGFAIGGIAGIHGQIGNIVVGAEFDGSFGAIDGKRRARSGVVLRNALAGFRRDKREDATTAAATPTSGSGVAAADAGSKLDADAVRRAPGFAGKASLDEFYSLRGRIGYSVEKALFYGTGGLGVAHAKVRANNPVLGRFSDDAYGFTPVVGGGIEYLFTENLSLRAEYLYALPFKVTMKDSETRSRSKASFDGTHMIRAGLSVQLPAF